MRNVLEALKRHHEKQAQVMSREIARIDLAEGARGVCPKTLEPHLLITYHSAPPASRLECHDCGATFRLDEDLLTAPHNRSRM